MYKLQKTILYQERNMAAEGLHVLLYKYKGYTTHMIRHVQLGR